MEHLLKEHPQSGIFGSVKRTFVGPDNPTLGMSNPSRRNHLCPQSHGPPGEYLSHQEVLQYQNGKVKYKELKEKVHGASTTSPPALERKIYAEFLGISEDRARIGLKLAQVSPVRLKF